MQRTIYNSVPTSECLSLGEATFQFFTQFVSRYQWAAESPGHSPRATEIAHAIVNRGKSGACTFYRPEGYKYILPVLHARHFEKAVNDRSVERQLTFPTDDN